MAYLLTIFVQDFWGIMMMSAKSARFRILLEFLNRGDRLFEPWDINSHEQRGLRLLLAASGKKWSNDYLLSLLAELRKTLKSLLASAETTDDLQIRDALEALWLKARRPQPGSPLHVRIYDSSELKDWMVPSARVEIAGKQLAIVEYQYESSPEFSFYRIIEDALRSGDFSLLRNCPHCDGFFLREGRRTTYCSTDCEIAFRYNKRIKEGYYQKAMKRVRKRRKKTKVQNGPAAYFEKLMTAIESDDTGKLLPVYKYLGGAVVGRRWLQKLRGTPWDKIDPEKRKTIEELSKEHPVPAAL